MIGFYLAKGNVRGRHKANILKFSFISMRDLFLPERKKPMHGQKV